MDAVLVPIFKKGDLSVCDNYRGISLLDVIGKVFARVLQTRLQRVAEEILPESQCGFRKGRGTNDMIFAVRQMVEKLREHNLQGFLLFVDLTKAYDSVPREALWTLLRKLGIPDETVRMVQGLHEGMEATVRVGDEETSKIKINNGVRQGCTLAPTLFNLYFAAVVRMWREQCEKLGIQLSHRNENGKLYESRSCKRVVHTVTEFCFADDAAVAVQTRDGLEKAAQVLVDVATAWGLTVSLKKTEFMVIGERNETDEAPITIQGESQTINCVKDFKYLGSKINEVGDIRVEVNERLIKASRIFGTLRRSVFEDKNISKQTKSLVYNATVVNTLLYGAETWTIPQRLVDRLESYNNRCLRTMAGITSQQQQEQRITSQQIRERCGVKRTIAEELRVRRLRWLGHLARMDEARLPKLMLFSKFDKARPQGGAKMRWKDRVMKDLKEVGVNPDTWYSVAQERGDWRRIINVSGKPGIESQVVSCPQCGKSCKRKGLHTHLRFCGNLKGGDKGGQIPGTRLVTLEGGDMVRKCVNCETVLKSSAGVMRHKCRGLGASSKPPKRKPKMTEKERMKLPVDHACTLCARKFKSACDLRRHTTIMHKPGV